MRSYPSAKHPTILPGSTDTGHPHRAGKCGPRALHFPGCIGSERSEGNSCRSSPPSAPDRPARTQNRTSSGRGGRQRRAPRTPAAPAPPPGQFSRSAAHQSPAQRNTAGRTRPPRQGMRPRSGCPPGAGAFQRVVFLPVSAPAWARGYCCPRSSGRSSCCRPSYRRKHGGDRGGRYGL